MIHTDCAAHGALGSGIAGALCGRRVCDAALVVGRQLTELLQERLGVQFSVADIRFNPFALTLSVYGLCSQ